MILIDSGTATRSIEGYTFVGQVSFDDLASYPKLIVGTDDELGNSYFLERQPDGTFRVTRSSSGIGLLLHTSLFTGNNFQYGKLCVDDNTGIRIGGFFYVRNHTSGTLTKSFEIVSIHIPDPITLQQGSRETQQAVHRTMNT